GHTPEGTREFLALEGIKEHLPSDFTERTERILGYYKTAVGGASPEVLARQAANAYAEVDGLMKDLNKFELSGASDTAKEQVKRFAVGFGSEFITGLENRFKTVRDKGPARDPKGALAGVDHANQTLFREEWQRRVDGLRENTNRFSTYRNDFGALE